MRVKLHMVVENECSVCRKVFTEECRWSGSAHCFAKYHERSAHHYEHMAEDVLKRPYYGETNHPSQAGSALEQVLLKAAERVGPATYAGFSVNEVCPTCAEKAIALFKKNAEGIK